jgi:uncharacterized membrane protein YdbT with pleckstrin-like domain
MIRLFLEPSELSQTTLILSHPCTAELRKKFTPAVILAVHLKRHRLPRRPRFEHFDPLRNWVALDAVAACLMGVFVSFTIDAFIMVPGPPICQLRP